MVGFTVQMDLMSIYSMFLIFGDFSFIPFVSLNENWKYVKLKVILKQRL